MKVKLVQATKNAGRMIADIASICYGREEAKNPKKLLKILFKNGHHSTFEHAYYTFKIEGISRTCLAQLTRHRHCSFTVESQRYTNQNANNVIMPPDIAKNDISNFLFKEFIQVSKDYYNSLIEEGHKKEDARFILPQSIETNLYMSCNLRELIHIYNLRVDKAAQWEIRELVQGMTKLVVEHSPELKFMFEKEE